MRESVPGPLALFIVGLLVAALGWVFVAGSYDPQWTSAGAGFEFLGLAAAALGVLIEFFVIGVTVRRISRTVGAIRSGSEGINNND